MKEGSGTNVGVEQHSKSYRWGYLQMVMEIRGCRNEQSVEILHAGRSARVGQ